MSNKIKKAKGNIVKDGDPEFDELNKTIQMLYEFFQVNEVNTSVGVNACLNIAIKSLKASNLSKQCIKTVVDNFWENLK